MGRGIVGVHQVLHGWAATTAFDPWLTARLFAGSFASLVNTPLTVIFREQGRRAALLTFTFAPLPDLVASLATERRVKPVIEFLSSHKLKRWKVCVLYDDSVAVGWRKNGIPVGQRLQKEDFAIASREHPVTGDVKLFCGERLLGRTPNFDDHRRAGFRDSVAKHNRS